MKPATTVYLVDLDVLRAKWTDPDFARPPRRGEVSEPEPDWPLTGPLSTTTP